MKKMDQRGQISIEFVLVMALMIVIVLSVGWYVSDSNESNIISSAARSGADNAVTALSMVNRSMVPVRVEDIITTSNGSNITISIDISGSLSAYQNQTIINSTLSSIAAQGYTLTNDSIVTSRHTYKIKLV